MNIHPSVYETTQIVLRLQCRVAINVNTLFRTNRWVVNKHKHRYEYEMCVVIWILWDTTQRLLTWSRMFCAYLFILCNCLVRAMVI